MTENRHFAVWARTLVGLVALAGLLGLSGCGGGSGAPNNVFNTPGALTLLPNPLTLYSATPSTLTIAGGQPPYTIVSSDQVALPVQANVNGSTVTVVPNTVSTATSLTLTARDAEGASSSTVVTIQPAPFINSLKLKADAYSDSCPNPTGSANPTDEIVSTFVCSGQTASLAIRLANVVGGSLAGRAVRFDIVQGAFQIFTELPGQTPTFALTYTVPTDQNGDAVVRIRAIPGAQHQTAIVQATDVSTGAFVRGTFVIVSTTNANAADLVVVPNAVDIKGPDNLTCSSGVSATFYIFGGQPPYTIVNPFPQALLLSPSVVQTSGAGFTVTTLGGCVDTATFAITDSAGHTTTATLTNELGDIAPASFTTPVALNIAPSSIATPLACGTSVSVIATGGGSITTTGNTQTRNAGTLSWSTSRPDAVSVIPSSTEAGQAVTVTRIVPDTPASPAPVGSTAVSQVSPPFSGTGNPPTVPPSLGQNANVTVTVSDGTQSKSLVVPVENRCTSAPTPP